MAKKSSHSLAAWMKRHSVTDRIVAEACGISRVQASRIRRHKSGTKKATALRLQRLTHIPWHHFVEPEVTEARAP